MAELQKNQISYRKFSLIWQLTVCASDSIFCVKTVRNVSTVFSSLATCEEVCNWKIHQCNLWKYK